MATIQSVRAREILDSRGNPTIEVLCRLMSGTHAHAMVPSGASTGVHEAHELRDGDAARYRGLGVLRAVEHVNQEINQRIGNTEFDQVHLDTALRDLDGTANKSGLGANAILGVSLAFARAAAIEKGIPLYTYLGSLVGNSSYSLPTPHLNVINGGKHADSGLDIQEFMLAPVGFDVFARKIQAGAEIITALKKLLEGQGYATSVGDEGGFAPKLASNEGALDVLIEAIESAGYTTEQIKIGIDAAASSFYKDGTYVLRAGEATVGRSSADMVAWYASLVERYPIISIEDGLAEDDWEGFVSLTEKLGTKITIVGDDLTVTNVKRIKEAAERKAINSVLIKPNQIGTLTETLEAITLTTKLGWTPFMSHRSGETTDTFIADLAVGLACPSIKAGSLSRGERVAKYNRLMEIESHLTT
jgi:enolase